MSDHLPECPVTQAEIAARKMDGHPRALCICDRLRACAQRIMEGWYEVQSETWVRGFDVGVRAAREERMKEDDDYAYVAAQAEAEGRRCGWNEALDAALEAVAALASNMANWSSAETAAATSAVPDLSVEQWMWAQRGTYRALAAIDALRSER